MNQFAIITALTPSDLMTPLRHRLQEAFFQALESQSSRDWTALLVGEEEREVGNLKFLRCESRDPSSRRCHAARFIAAARPRPKFVIRLDDDDIISPTILEHAAKKEFDCLADRYHAFGEISSQMFCQAKKGWLPNTVIHRTEHALAPIPETGAPLICSDHSKHWMPYYRRRNLRFQRRNQAVYLRVLSPTSLSIVRKTNGSSQELRQAYEQYVRSRGRWRRRPVKGFEGWASWAAAVANDPECR